MKINVRLLHGLSWTATISNLQMEKIDEIWYVHCSVKPMECLWGCKGPNEILAAYYTNVIWEQGRSNHDLSVLAIPWQQRYIILQMYRHTSWENLFSLRQGYRGYSLTGITIHCQHTDPLASFSRILIYSPRTQDSCLCHVLLIKFCLFLK